MRVFVGQKSPTGNSCTPVCKVIGTRTVLARLVVLEALAADNVADRKEEIVAIIVMRMEELLPLHHKVPVVLQFLGSDLQIGRFVGEDIEVHRVVRPSGQV